MEFTKSTTGRQPVQRFDDVNGCAKRVLRVYSKYKMGLTAPGVPKNYRGRSSESYILSPLLNMTPKEIILPFASTSIA